VQPGMPATINVDAYPNRAFQGTVSKVLPQGQVVQNVTMFPVLIAVPNPGHLLRPGMNTEVRIPTGRRPGVLAVPNAALRTSRDVSSAAGLLGLDSLTVAQQIAAGQSADTGGRTGRDTAAAGGGGGGGGGGGAQTVTLPNGQTVTLPPGVTPQQFQAALKRMRSGAEPTPADRGLLSNVFGRAPRPKLRQQRQTRNNQNYVVFALRDGKVVAAPIKTGLTDQDYVEVTSGLTERDTVLVLPSASLVQAQQQFRQRFQNVTGGGLPGLRQQSGGSR